MTLKIAFAIFAMALSAGSAMGQDVPPLVDLHNPPSGITPPKPMPDSIKYYYPPQALRCSAEGVVGMEMTVLADGTVGSVRVTQSSGYRILDAETIKEMLMASYTPALENGKPVAVRFNAKYIWSLDHGPHTVLQTCLKALGAGEPPPQ